MSFAALVAPFSGVIREASQKLTREKPKTKINLSFVEVEEVISYILPAMEQTREKESGSNFLHECLDRIAHAQYNPHVKIHVREDLYERPSQKLRAALSSLIVSLGKSNGDADKKQLVSFNADGSPEITPTGKKLIRDAIDKAILRSYGKKRASHADMVMIPGEGISL